MHSKLFQFTAGPLVGRVIRVELKEIQRPLINRKTSTPTAERSVDRIERRPLDPPPVVNVRLFEIEHGGTADETAIEIDASSSAAFSGFVCHVDLFAVNEPEGFRGPKPVKQWAIGTTVEWPRPAYPDVLEESTDALEYQEIRQRIDREEKALEQMKVTDKLFGCIVVNAVLIKDLENRPSAVFVFGDVSVRTEGYFVLRYRCFDVFSTINARETIPICAETWSSPFVVVGTKEFPGLRASTELTKHLASYGIPVNWRGYGRSQRQMFAQRDGNADDGYDEEDESSQQPEMRSAHQPELAANRRRAGPSAQGGAGRQGPAPARQSLTPTPQRMGPPPTPQRTVMLPLHPASPQLINPAVPQPMPNFGPRPPSRMGPRPPSRMALTPTQAAAQQHPPYRSDSPRIGSPTAGPSRGGFPSLTAQVPEFNAGREVPSPTMPMPPLRQFGPPPPPPGGAAPRYTSLPARTRYEEWQTGDRTNAGQKRTQDDPERRL